MRQFLRHLDEHVAVLQTPQEQASTTGKMLRDLLSRGTALGLDNLPCDPSHYTRYLIHADPQNRYAVVAMQWGAGQSTPIHGHDNAWCVEGLYRGQLHITPYDARAVSDDVFQFSSRADEHAQAGDVGVLVPPDEYHKMSNATADAAVTLHVYGHELQQCERFTAHDGVWLRDIVPLRYDGLLR
jgi:predicted metal-dependent enzyme (double-stranded beta helix superfamily)